MLLRRALMGGEPELRLSILTNPHELHNAPVPNCLRGPLHHDNRMQDLVSAYGVESCFISLFRKRVWTFFFCRLQPTNKNPS